MQRSTICRLVASNSVSHFLLGNSQIGVTLDTYGHVLPVLQSEAADEMDKALGRASGG